LKLEATYWISSVKVAFEPPGVWNM
jgi:hypothetical protein